MYRYTDRSSDRNIASGSKRGKFESGFRRDKDNMGFFDGNRNGVCSVYVTGFSAKATWMWIRNMFREFGDVLGVFVSLKRTRMGDRFAFVRYRNRAMATKDVQCLNGRYVAGRNLIVDYAKGEGRMSYWRKKDTTKNDQRRKGEAMQDYGKTEDVDKGNQNNRKSCQLQIDLEKSKILEECYVGTTMRCCNTEYLLDRFQAMNLHEVWLSRIASKIFVIGFFSDEVRRDMVKDNWCFLKEWFSEIWPWRLELMMEECIARLRIQGLPLVAWNKENFGNIAKLWGELVMDECCVTVPDDARSCTIHVLLRSLRLMNK